jgi:putative transposase
MLRDRLGVSERRACRYVDQHRSAQRREPVLAADDQALRAALRAFAARRPRWGYRRAHHHLLQEGWQVNRKRVQRVWREEGLRVPRTRRRKRAVGEGPDGRDINAAAPDDVWALDFQADQTSDGRPIRLVNIIDEHTREALIMHAARSIDADEVVARLDALVARRGRAPRYVRIDNGPELTSHALRDWCRFSAAGSVFIKPGCPWQNPFVESFHARVRDELLNASSSRASPKPGCSSRLARGLQPAPTTLGAGDARPGHVRRRPSPIGDRSRVTRADGSPIARLALGLASRRAIRPTKHLAWAPATTTRLS